MKKPRPPSRTHSRAGRKRRATGWTLLTLGVTVAGLWVASGWWSLAYVTSFPPITVIEVRRGVVAVDHDVNPYGAPFPVGFQVEGLKPAQSGLDLLASGPEKGDQRPSFYPRVPARNGLNAAVFFRARATHRGTTTRIVLWPIPLLLFAVGIPTLRSGILARRRAATNSCTRCGYTLAGLDQGTACPECGKGAVTD